MRLISLLGRTGVALPLHLHASSSAGALRPHIVAGVSRALLSSSSSISTHARAESHAAKQSKVEQGRNFEQACGTYLQDDLGCMLSQSTGKSGDGGVDLYGTLPSPSTIRFIVQCKDHKKRLGAHELRALEAVLARHQRLGPHVALFMTTKGVSEAAKEYIETSPFAMGCLVMKGGCLQEARLNHMWFKSLPKTEVRSRIRPDGSHECVLLLDTSA